MVNLSFALNVTGTYRLRFLAGRLSGQSILAVGRHSSVHTCENDASTASFKPFNNHPYISSSDTPVSIKFTATYVGMVVE